MLHNEARKLLVETYEQTHDAQTVAKYFQVSTSTVYRLSGQMKKTGSVDLQTSQRGRKAAPTEEDLQAIDQLIIAQPDITIDEIIKKQFRKRKSARRTRPCFAACKAHANMP